MIALIGSSVSWAQRSNDAGIEAEVDAVQGPVEVPPPKNEKEKAPPVKIERATTERHQKKATSAVDEEMRMQNEVLRRKEADMAEQVNADRNVDRFPETKPLFVKPPGPKQGGTLRVEHPKSADGLIRINKDGSYQYKTPLQDKSRSGAFKVGVMTPPKIKSQNSDVTFESMYGKENVFAIDFDYEWQPFRKYGALGLKVGTGFSTVSASGYFKRDMQTRSEESYNLFIVPLSAFLEYRFEYVRQQWVVPFINGGATYYGLAEVRNDGKSPTFAGAPAAGAGGGLLFSLSRLDPAGAFTLSQEYGIADLWFIVEARAMQGLSEDIDFTNQTISAGIAVDF
jgi:hypothetical protein